MKVCDTFFMVTLSYSGLVHPKNEKSLIIYSPSTSSCFRPVWVSFFCWTQKKIFWRKPAW